MADFRLHKGYDIKISGKPESSWGKALAPEKIAIRPDNFLGLRPKLSVAAGDQVKAGSSLFFHKNHPELHVTSPVSGKILQINRGEKRVILDVVIAPSATQTSESFKTISAADLLKASREQILGALLHSGLAAHLTQRPLGGIIDPEKKPRDIFISAYHTAPLSADIALILEGQQDAFQAGLNALTRLTDGAVYLSYEGAADKVPAALKNAQNVIHNTFKGPHPAGNVGVQIHHIKPIHPHEVVWTLKPMTVIRIGKLFLEGKLSGETVVAVGGECAKERKHFKTLVGAEISSFIQGNVLLQSPLRFISGDVLTGRQVSADGFLRVDDHQLAVIPECHEKEFLGWLSPGFSKESFSGAFLSRFFPRPVYSHHTGFHGGHRAFVQTGIYEDVTPMDLYPVHLIKAILSEEIEEMEGLGLLEVLEEDLALCDYICPSKNEFQAILRRGLELYRKESHVEVH